MGWRRSVEDRQLTAVSCGQILFDLALNWTGYQLGISQIDTKFSIYHNEHGLFSCSIALRNHIPARIIVYVFAKANLLLDWSSSSSPACRIRKAGLMYLGSLSGAVSSRYVHDLILRSGKVDKAALVVLTVVNQYTGQGSLREAALFRVLSI